MWVHTIVIVLIFSILVAFGSIQTYRIGILKDELGKCGNELVTCERERIKYIGRWNGVSQKFEDCVADRNELKGKNKRTNSKPRERYDAAYFTRMKEQEEADAKRGFLGRLFRKLFW